MADLTSILRQAGFSGAALDTAYAIAMAESGGNARAFNGNYKTGDRSYGLFQINMLGGMGPERRAQFGLSNNDELYDAVRNAQIAYKMSKGGRDWTPWSTYNNDTYRKYLGKTGATVTTKAPATATTVPGQPAAPPQPEQADIIGSPTGNDFAPDRNDFAPDQRDFAQRVRQPDATLEAPSTTTAARPRAGGSSSLRDKAIAAAMSQLGVSYSWGGGTTKGPSVGFGKGAGIRGFDCSSLIMYAYAQAGYSMPRTGRPQLALGTRAPISSLRPGDFLGWGDGHHIAMYIGNNQYIQAPSTGGHVEIKTLSKGSSAWGVRLNLPGD